MYTTPITEIRRFEQNTKPLHEMRPMEIMSMVERKLHTTLKSKTRFRYEVDARMIFVFLCRRTRRPMSINRLAQMIGKDHCTLLHYQKVFPVNFRDDPDVCDMVLEAVGSTEYLRIEKELMGSKAPSFKNFNIPKTQ